MQYISGEYHISASKKVMPIEFNFQNRREQDATTSISKGSQAKIKCPCYVNIYNKAGRCNACIGT